jgi:hypothetical protein
MLTFPTWTLFELKAKMFFLNQLSEVLTSATAEAILLSSSLLLASIPRDWLEAEIASYEEIAITTKKQATKNLRVRWKTKQRNQVCTSSSSYANIVVKSHNDRGMLKRLALFFHPLDTNFVPTYISTYIHTIVP